MAEVSLVKLYSTECQWTLLMVNQYWFRYWLGAVRHQAITWANVDPDLCHHMSSLGHNELMDWFLILAQPLPGPMMTYCHLNQQNTQICSSSLLWNTKATPCEGKICGISFKIRLWALFCLVVLYTIMHCISPYHCKKTCITTQCIFQDICTWFVLCCGLVWIGFIPILQGCFTGIGAITWLPQCQWSNPEEYDDRDHMNPIETGDISRKTQNKTQHNCVYILRNIRQHHNNDVT